MSAKEILVPDIGDFQDVDVIEVHLNVGQHLRVDDPMITLENDKASMDIPAPEEGIVREVKLKVGEKVSQGSLILLLDPAIAAKEAPKSAPSAPSVALAEAAVAPPAPSTAKASPATASPAAPATAQNNTSNASFARVYASPSIRRLAREKGIDLNLIAGTGRKGRITQEDLENFLKQGAKAAKEKAAAANQAAVGSGIPPIPAVDFAKFGPIKTLEFGRIKRLTAQAMTRSWLNIPHVTHNDEADITSLEDFRQSLKAESEKRGVRITLLSFIMRAVATSLKAFPTFNASLDPSGEKLILKEYIHLGIAVDTPQGLVVPVIRDVDQKSIYQLSEDLATISKKARDNKLAISDIQGGTFTISSLGGIGGTSFTPIINAPEVAILGLTRSQMKPMWDGKGFIPRLMQPLSLSYDHRVIDGAEAARFCRHLAATLEDIRRILL
jgi:pyruvate dehydrogenase E2 component (dihydrolipoamide acetyltransferase)